MRCVTVQPALTSGSSTRTATARYARVTISAFRTASRSGYAVVAHAIAHPPGEPDAQNGDILATRLEDTLHQLAESNALLASEVAHRTEGEAARIRLLRRLVVAQEDERRRIARDLHDDLGQRLSALRLTLEALATRAERPTHVLQVTAAALASVAQIDQSLDFLAWELRPAALDELGLTKVLDTYVHEWSRHSGVRTLFHARVADTQRFAPEVEATVYRITQEALNNIAKHARAQSVNVLLESRGDTLVLAVEDDGIGCRTDTRGETMVGLTGMRERAAAVGGTLEIEPTPGGGATVLAHIPMATRSPRGRPHDPAVEAHARCRPSRLPRCRRTVLREPG